MKVILPCRRRCFSIMFIVDFDSNVLGGYMIILFFQDVLRVLFGLYHLTLSECWSIGENDLTWKDTLKVVTLSYKRTKIYIYIYMWINMYI